MQGAGQPTHQVPGKPSSFPCYFEQEMVSSPGRIFKSTHLFLQKAWNVVLHRASPSCRSWMIIQSLFPPLPEPPNPIKLLLHLFLVKKFKKEETYQPSSCVNAQRQPLSSWIWVHRQCLSSPSGFGTSSFWTAWAAALNIVIFHNKINMHSLLYRFAAKPALCAAQCKLKRCSMSRGLHPPGFCAQWTNLHGQTGNYTTHFGLFQALLYRILNEICSQLFILLHWRYCIEKREVELKKIHPVLKTDLPWIHESQWEQYYLPEPLASEWLIPPFGTKIPLTGWVHCKTTQREKSNPPNTSCYSRD